MSNLKAIKRENASSSSNNKLRADGFIPAILYGGKTPNQNISIEKKAIKSIVNSDTFLSKVLELDINGKKEKVIPRDVAFHVVSEEPIHIDFMRILAGKKIILEIPVKFINHPDSPGLKRGGVLNIVRRKVELQCPGENIPDDITVDLAGTDIGTSIKISSVKLPNDVVPTISDRDFTIATVVAPTIVVEPEKTTAETPEGEEAAAAGEEGAAPAEGTTAKEGAEEKTDDKKSAKPGGKSDDKKSAKPGEDKGKAPSKKPEKK